ncbi:MAG TPA: M56 family metallopeptidase [Candidatus Acidoferrum sp.]|nr:M56 family metallopeptidase [Candidatus Acidoferrum sp.]
MMVPYVLRLLCICMAAFFLVNAALGLLVSLFSSTAIRIAERMRARSAARFLLVLRLLPAAMGLGAVLALCIPSYLWLEPESIAERVGWIGFALVLLALVTLSASFVRGLNAVVVSLRFHSAWRQISSLGHLSPEHPNTVIVEEEGPLLALAGVFRPRLFISESVLRVLTAEELEVALEHENVHRSSRDNLKRLLLALSPIAIPFLSGFALIEQSWAKLSEWAADDEAARGDANRALSLATALLRVARLGAGPRLSFLHTSLVAGDYDLSARVERLLHLDVRRAETVRPSRYVVLVGGFCFAVCALILANGPAALSSVHRLLETFLR